MCTSFFPSQQSSGDESVSPVVSLAADDDDRFSGERSVPFFQMGDDAGAGSFHQGEGRDMRLHDRSVVEGAHLVAGHDWYHGVSVTCGVASTGCRRCLVLGH